MPKTLPKVLRAAGAMAAAFAVATPPAHANPTLGTFVPTLISIALQDTDVHQDLMITVTTDTNLTGEDDLNLSYGTFDFNDIIATGTSNLAGIGSPLAEPNLDTTLNFTTTGAGKINVFITQQALSSPTGINNFLSTFTAQAFTGGVTSVTEKTYVSTTDGLYTGPFVQSTLLASTNFTGQGTETSTNATPSLATPYSETIEYTITATGAGSGTDSVNISLPMSGPGPVSVPVPEPASLGLLSMGLVGLGMLRQRRRWV